MSDRVSRPESALKFVILSMLTLGVYEWYWGWRAWATVRSLSKQKLNATLRAGFFGFTMFWLVAALGKRLRQRPTLPLAAAAAYLVVNAASALALDALKLKGVLLLLACLLAGLAAGIILLPVHRMVARIWKEHPELASDAANLTPNKRLGSYLGLIVILSLWNIYQTLHP